MSEPSGIATERILKVKGYAMPRFLHSGNFFSACHPERHGTDITGKREFDPPLSIYAYMSTVLFHIYRQIQSDPLVSSHFRT